MSRPVVHVALRDDDTCFFTDPEELASCYGSICKVCPVSLSIVPFHGCTKSGAVPKQYWRGDRVFPLADNAALVGFLREGIAAGRIHATLHGYHHRDEPAGFEFVAGSDLDRKVVEGRRYLEETLGQPVRVFVPPHNAMGRKGYDAVRRAGLDICGIQPFRAAVRGWDPRVMGLGLRRRLERRRYGFAPPWPIRFPDGHREVPHTTATPRVPLERLVAAFENVRRHGGVFCVATHYWEFDAPMEDGSGTLRDSLLRLWEHMGRHESQLRFVSLADAANVRQT